MLLYRLEEQNLGQVSRRKVHNWFFFQDLQQRNLDTIASFFVYRLKILTKVLSQMI